MSMKINGIIGQIKSDMSSVCVNQQDNVVYTSIYNMLKSGESDNNENFLLDAKDFEDETLLDFAKSKGLIGRTWNNALNYVKYVIHTNKEHAIEVRQNVFNDRTGEYYDSTLQNGREISRTYYKIDDSGNKVIDEIINLEYDESGNVNIKIYLDTNGNVTDMTFVSPKDETKVLKRTQFDENGNVQKYAMFNDNNEVIEFAVINREIDTSGITHISQETHTYIDNKWVINVSEDVEPKIL